MSDITSLIESLHNISKIVERMADDDKQFCVDMQLRLQQTSWEIYRQANDLKELVYYVGA